MKINKIFLLAEMALTGFGFASCSDDDSYSPGKPAGSNNVYFVDEAHQVLDLTATADAGSALTVPLKQLQVASVFTVPATVEFAAGQTEVEVPIQISSDAEPFTDYQLRLAIPEEYTSPYRVQDYVPELNVQIHKEDYKDYAAIEYYDDFWYGEKWEDVIQYSATLDQVHRCYGYRSEPFFLWKHQCFLGYHFRFLRLQC